MITGVKAPLMAYRLQIGHYPTTAEGLEALLKAPPGNKGRWAGPYLDQALLDSWGRPYGYRCPGVHSSVGFDIWSEGPDPSSSEDDIGNW